jgi:hypothetical protein
MPKSHEPSANFNATGAARKNVGRCRNKDKTVLFFLLMQDRRRERALETDDSFWKKDCRKRETPKRQS